ncbi:MAG: class I adenylate-forming enzyme family protein [Sphingomicrobium sp.]
MTGWPALSIASAHAALTAPGAPFEMALVDIRGVPTRVWKNAPPTIPALIEQSRAHGTRDFVVLGDERLTYDGHYRAVATLAHWLIGERIARGERVALAMRNLPEWPVIFFAVAATGAIIVPLNAWSTGPELAAMLADCGASLLFCDAEREERVAPELASLPELLRVIVTRSRSAPSRLEDIIGEVPNYGALPEVNLPNVAINPDDDASLLYTSGTTGSAKGAIGTHRNLMSNIHSTAFAGARNFLRRGQPLPLPAPRVRLLTVPLFHATAISASLITGMPAGNTNILMRRWDAGEALALIERELVQITGGVPTIAWQLLDHPDRDRFDLSSLDTIAYGGAPASPELALRLKAKLGVMPGTGWGMTETTSTVTSHSAEDYLARPDSCGPPVAVADLKIVAEDGVTELPSGSVGELWARGPMVVRGYWNRPEATAATFVDGWVRTGDIARLDDDGFCFIVDRAKDVIIRGGENIYSVEVEHRIELHPAVAEAALVALPHATLGEVPAAIVHLHPGADLDEADLQAWLRERIAAFKVPVRMNFTPAPLPRTASGKLIKRGLADLFAQPAAA